MSRGGSSKQFQALASAMKDRLFVGSDSWQVAREKLEGVHGHPIEPGTSVEWVELGGVRCAWVVAEQQPSAALSAPLPAALPAALQRTLVLLHGGAYIAAGGDGYLFYAEMLSRICGLRVLLVDYRLAPEHRHPAALDDCVSAYRGLLAAGERPESIALIGDSCGGGFVLTTLLRLRDQRVELPAAGVALGGWFDLEAEADSARAPVGFDPFAERAFTRARGLDYVGPGGDVRDPLVSPVHADLQELPPLLLQVGQIDLTRDDALRVAAKAGKQGVAVTVEVHPGMFHGFQGLANAGIPEAGFALDRVASFLHERLA